MIDNSNFIGDAHTQVHHKTLIQRLQTNISHDVVVTPIILQMITTSY